MTSTIKPQTFIIVLRFIRYADAKQKIQPNQQVSPKLSLSYLASATTRMQRFFTGYVLLFFSPRDEIRQARVVGLATNDLY